MFDIFTLRAMNRRFTRQHGQESFLSSDQARAAAEEQVLRTGRQARVYQRGKRFYVRPCLLPGLEHVPECPRNMRLVLCCVPRSGKARNAP